MQITEILAKDLSDVLRKCPALQKQRRLPEEIYPPFSISLGHLVMFSLWPLAVTAVDDPTLPASEQNPFPLELQTFLMIRFYSEISAEGLQEMSHNDKMRDYCEWLYTDCTDGVVTGVGCYGKNYGHFAIHTLPPTVATLAIVNSYQSYTLHTRAFPRDLISCDLSQNNLFGPVELRTLPSKLVGLMLPQNQLIGPIDLTSLPQTLKYLYLHRNSIWQAVVLYSDLPPNIETIMLSDYRASQPSNRIGRVRALYPESRLKNPKFVFKDFRSRQLQ
ncbi:leucine-rich repeat protein [Perkinsela sp. CCAP 1560/4]|nr:leucine-rich repeat protein [Perkinsela sp. CCAP 1560/4]|eukprot:KNH02435.1 leucine-rich repeat protein [Perkinsela sp. CCAP 1560/4]